MRIAVISDTHNRLRQGVLDEIGRSDAVLHAGDVCRPVILDEIRMHMKPTAPIYVVRGNNDWELRQIAVTQKFELGGFRFFMIHNRMQMPPVGDRQIVIYGHTHVYSEQMIGDTLWLNPGSCGPRRFGSDATMAILTIADGRFRVEKINLNA